MEEEAAMVLDRVVYDPQGDGSSFLTTLVKGLFVFAPLLVLLGSLLAWAAFPWAPGFVAADLDLGLFYIFAVSSLVILGLLMSGWASNNKYALFGGMRSAAQIISYEIPALMLLLVPVMIVGIVLLFRLFEQKRV